MKDHIIISSDPETGLFYALLYRNHPTPSGCDRPILALSTNEGKKTTKEALDSMLSGLKPTYVKEIDIPNLVKEQQK